MPDGPLEGLRVLEFAGLGPVPFCGMLLADMGATVVRIDRPGTQGSELHDFMSRGRLATTINLKHKGAVDFCIALIENCDVLIEGFRPRVMERLGLGPDIALRANPRLIYGRATGWGQSGPYADRAGHDINYLAITGLLHAIGPAAKPVPPLNLIGDFGGGALYLTMGVLAAHLHVRSGGVGQVVDSAMVDGATSLATSIHSFMASGKWSDRREANFLDGGAPYYGVYQCADGNWISVGAIEPEFFSVLVGRLGLEDRFGHSQDDRSRWPDMRGAFEAAFRSRTRAEWCDYFDGLDACVAPVLSLTEAPQNTHNENRDVFIDFSGAPAPAPAPRFAGSPSRMRRIRYVEPDALLKEFSVAPDRARQLLSTMP